MFPYPSHLLLCSHLPIEEMGKKSFRTVWLGLCSMACGRLSFSLGTIYHMFYYLLRNSSSGLTTFCVFLAHIVHKAICPFPQLHGGPGLWLAAFPDVHSETRSRARINVVMGSLFKSHPPHPQKLIHSSRFARAATEVNLVEPLHVYDFLVIAGILEK